MYCFAFILDPRVKLQGLSKCLMHIGSCLDIDYSSYYNTVHNKLYEFYGKYECKFGGNILNEQQQSTQEEQRSKKFCAWRDLISTIGVGSSSSISSSAASSTTQQYLELKTYLQADVIESDQQKDFNILQWWQMRQARFPILSRLARDVLTIPVSTVSSESAFSTAGRILEERRTSLTSEMVEVLTCLRDWEHAAIKSQHTTHNEDLVEQFENMYIVEEDENLNIGSTSRT